MPLDAIGGASAVAVRQENPESLEHPLPHIGEVLDHGLARGGSVAAADRLDDGEVFAAGGEQALGAALDVTHPDLVPGLADQLFQRAVAAMRRDLVVDLVV